MGRHEGEREDACRLALFSPLEDLEETAIVVVGREERCATTRAIQHVIDRVRRTASFASWHLVAE